MLRIRWPSLILCAAILWLLCLHGSLANPVAGSSGVLERRNPPKPKFVFRVDSRSPAEIKVAKGFLGRATDQRNLGQDTAYSIDNHNEYYWRSRPTVFVSTTSEFGVAARFAQPGDYIYRVRARPNMISVNTALGHRSRYPWQEEWVAVGGVPHYDIVSSMRVPDTGIYPDPDDEEDSDDEELEKKIRDKVKNLEDEYDDKYKAEFERNINPDYREGVEIETSTVDELTMRSLSGFGSQPLVDIARQFMDNHGAGVGWVRGQQFPLWTEVAPEQSLSDIEGFVLPDLSYSSDSDSNSGSRFTGGELLHHPGEFIESDDDDSSNIPLTVAFAACALIYHDNKPNQRRSETGAEKSAVAAAFRKLDPQDRWVTCVRISRVIKGRPLVEILWVSMDNIDNENPGDLYGLIRVRDGLSIQDIQHIYYIDRPGHQSIYPHDHIALTGPHRAISAARMFDMYLFLLDKDTYLSKDESLEGSVSWDAKDPRNKYDVPISTVIKNTEMQATVKYVVMRNAAQAVVDVFLIDGDGEHPADVYGKIRVSSKFIQRDLFYKEPWDFISIAPTQHIPLSRAVMAVPIYDDLKVHIELWDRDFFSPDDEIAKGYVKFRPGFGSTTQTIKGNHGSVNVTVTWS